MFRVLSLFRRLWLSLQTGTDIQSIQYHNAHITFREVGSTLITKWPTYFEEAQVIMVRPRSREHAVGVTLPR